MGKRLIRVFKNKLVEKKDALKGKEADVVLTNAAVFHGYITSINENGLTLLNKRDIKQDLSLEEIDVVIYDQEASY